MFRSAEAGPTRLPGAEISEVRVLARMLLRVVRVSRVFLQPQRAHIANHLQRFVPADQAHIALHNFWCSHMEISLFGALERKFVASRGESL